MEAAIDTLVRGHGMDEQEVKKELESLAHTPTKIAMYPHTYEVQVCNGMIESKIVDTYGEESTLRMLDAMRREDPDSFK